MLTPKPTYPDLASRSAALYERARRRIPAGGSRALTFVKPYPVYAAKAEGCVITDVDGVERLDFIANYTVQIHGHGHPAIVAAIKEQVERAVCMTLPTELEIELAEMLCARATGFERIRFTNSGTEAVMVAMKAARAFTGRPKIAKCEGVYHGGYDYAEVSLDSDPQNWGGEQPVSVGYTRGVPAGVLADMVVLPFNDVAGSLKVLEANAAGLAGILLDPVPSRCGGLPATPEYLAALQSFARSNGSLFMFDEVVSFRLDYGGAQSRLGVVPDMTTLGKIIGGGLPIGAVAGKAEVMAVFDQSAGKAAYPHSGTFNANPLTMAAGIAAMRLLSRESLDRLNALGDRARVVLRQAFTDAGVAGQVTGEGSLFLLHFGTDALGDYRRAYRAHSERDQERLAQLYRNLLNHGVIISSWGLGCLSTPMGEIEIARLGQATLAALRDLKAQEAHTEV